MRVGLTCVCALAPGKVVLKLGVYCTGAGTGAGAGSVGTTGKTAPRRVAAIYIYPAKRARLD